MGLKRVDPSSLSPDHVPTTDSPKVGRKKLVRWLQTSRISARMLQSPDCQLLQRQVLRPNEITGANVYWRSEGCRGLLRRGRGARDSGAKTCWGQDYLGNLLKRKPARIEGKGKRKYKKSRGENVPISGQPLKSGKAKAPGRLTLVQQCAQKSSRGSKAEWLVHRVLCHACLFVYLFN
jgi:hypothetical protein